MKNIQKALDSWGRYGRLNFQRAYDPNADIIVAFGSGYHGDIFPFDGRGNVLAHAFFPYEYSDTGGDIHFDNDEKWIDKSENSRDDEGTDFYTVALHELGHSLGLAHTPDPTAVMFPYYKGYEGNVEPQLSHDDIMGMYMLYIARMLKEDYNTPYGSFDETEQSTRQTSRSTVSSRYNPRWTPETTTLPYTRPSSRTTKRHHSRPTKVHTIPPASTTEGNPPGRSSTSTMSYEGDYESVEVHKKHDDKQNIPDANSPSMPNICDGFVDAVATLRSELFVFKDQYIWRFKRKGQLERGYPVPLTQMFPNLPKNIKKVNAAYERADGMIVIFTDRYFWLYDGHQFVDSPRPLTDYGLPDYLDGIDAVQTWARNGKTYFYKNERFWRYNETSKSMDSGYPLHMERWRGVPENLDAATTWTDGITYFFKAELFWKFDNDWVIVTEESPFPTAQVWFGCPEEPRKMKRLFS